MATTTSGRTFQHAGSAPKPKLSTLGLTCTPLWGPNTVTTKGYLEQAVTSSGFLYGRSRWLGACVGSENTLSGDCSLCLSVCFDILPIVQRYKKTFPSPSQSKLQKFSSTVPASNITFKHHLRISPSNTQL